ncbi:hypothetical protein [Pseudonocardia cypriaca]|uniref:hypothetical protein n=1 Tax=Pseudonocardia cypriaca TaxID=882449 RepID=UPI001477356A|nr:hypothetical protein [Pseudonocardia cypriaca]
MSVDFIEDVDDVEADELTDNLRAELLNLDVDYIVRPRRSESAPAGAKSADLMTVGLLTASVAQPVIAALLLTARTWLKNRPAKTIRIKIGDDEIEIDQASRADRMSALRIFADKHGGAS